MLHRSRNKQEKHCHTCLSDKIAIKTLTYVVIYYCNDLKFVAAHNFTGIFSCIHVLRYEWAWLHPRLGTFNFMLLFVVHISCFVCNFKGKLKQPKN
jgi:hypothetical protein